MSYPYTLADEDKRELLGLARSALEEVTRSGCVSTRNADRPEMLSPGAAFVSLHVGPALRGCIGTMAADKPLSQTVREMAVAAGTRDPRFPALGEQELPVVTVEISVLGQFADVARPGDFEIGQHGLVLDVGGRRGLLLPQVAVEHHLDETQFLAMVCRKAGAADDAWQREDARVQRFTAQVFSESDFAPNL